MPENDVNERLSPVQVRNPKLGPAKSNSLVESVAWGPGETLGFSILMGGIGYIATVVVMFILDIVFLGGGFWLTDGDAISPANYAIIGGMGAAGLTVLTWWTQFIGPKVYPPLEFDTVEQKEAHEYYESLDWRLKSELANAYILFMEATPETRDEAKYIWVQARSLLEKREEKYQLEQKQLEEAAQVTFVDPRLEEAKHDIERLKREVEGA